MILWISGISGSGKTTLGKQLFKFLKTKIKNLVYIDGDDFRAIFKNDLDYSLKSRNLNAFRMTRLVKYLSEQKINIIVAANITTVNYRAWCRKNLKQFFDIHITANLENLLMRDYKNLYKNALNKKIKNVVGLDIPFKKPKNCKLYLTNNGTKKEFLVNVKKIIKSLKT